MLGSISGQEIKILQVMVGRPETHTNPDSLIGDEGKTGWVEK